MVAPTYTTDLTTIAIGSTTVDTGTWNESSDAGWDTGGSMVDDGNLYYNGTKCVSAQMTKDASGSGTTGPATIMYVHGSTWTIPTDGAALIHHLWAAPPALNTVSVGGIKILLGNGLANFSAWDISGSDFFPAPKGGWTNYAINPAVGTADDIVGTGASSPYTTVGIAVAATAQARGNPNACNAVRYGRCKSIFQYGDGTNGYATFEGFGDTDATSTNKWSLIDSVEGGYKYQGLMSIGSTNAVDFRDSNVNLFIANTTQVTSGFNAIEVNNASSNVAWTAINISALGTVSKGTFEVVDNATVAKTNCTFTDMNTFIYQSNSTLTNTIYRRCGQVTQGSAVFDTCTFDNSTSATTLVVNSLGDIDDCTFISDGTNYAMDLGTVSSTTSMNCDNYFTDYQAYSSGGSSTGNEVIKVNVASGQTLTINVGSGYDSPSFHNSGTGTVTVVSSVTLTIDIKDSDGNTVTDACEVTVVKNSDTSVLYHAESVTTGTTDYGFDGSLSGTAIYINILNVADYEPRTVAGITLPSANSSITIQLTNDRFYENI